MDFQGYLTGREDGSPSGENLEYDMDFISLELAAAPGEEKQAGKAILAAEDPDWSDVQEKALVVLGRSQDLRAAVHLAQAVLYTEGLPGFAEVCGYIRTVLEKNWDTVHPQLDADDDNDPTARINAVQNLAGAQTVIRALRRTPLAESRGFGRVSLKDIQAATGEVPGDGTGPDSGQIAAAFQDTDPAVLAKKLAAARSAADHVGAIDKLFSDKLPGQGPQFDELIRVIRTLGKVLAERSGADAAPDEAAAAGDGDAAASAAPGGGGGSAPAAPPGSINSQRDVHAALDRIMAYYQKEEPSSPVPILLVRAKKLVGADFMTIMKDMAPKGLDNVRLITGASED